MVWVQTLQLWLRQPEHKVVIGNVHALQQRRHSQKRKIGGLQVN